VIDSLRAEAPAWPASRSVAARRLPWWGVGVLVGVVYLALIVPQLATSGPLSFVRVGRDFVDAARTSSVLSGLPPTSKTGYDGQYYFGVAVDPAHARDYIAPATSPGYVYSRPLYPALARALGLGSTNGVAYAMVFLNVAAVLLGTLAIAGWLRRRGLPSAYALLYGFYPGLGFSVFRDLTEPLAYGLVALALYVFDRRTPRAIWGAGVLLALAALTRETTAVFALGFAAALVASGRTERSGPSAWRRGLAFLAGAVAPLFVWRLAIGAWLHSPTQERPGSGLASLVPFHAYASSWPWDHKQTLAVLGVVVPTVLALVAVALLARMRAEWLPIVLLVLNAVAFVVLIPTPVFVDYVAVARAGMGVLLCAALCAPMLVRGGRSGAAALLLLAWSPVWFVLAGAFA
jgi:hypothetical protein